ncbi:MAG TPA: citrate synthase, partial [Candidatus Melainabacteria bacterium]|nr:citrate synthase [Candidatus Melainabacteria bacterium]
MPESSKKVLTGSQAAEFLGVKPATLYAYVSRGLIKSTSGPTARERSYRLSDLIKLRQSVRGFKANKNEKDPSWTGPVIKSSITEIKEDGHRYRGRNAIDLVCQETPFEFVTELLWET